MNDIKIGEQIKQARSEAQLTQSELGEKIGVTWEMISRYENGKSSPRKNLEGIATALGKPIQYFFGIEEESIGEEIKKLTHLLETKGQEIESVGTVPYIENIGEFTLKKALMYTKQTYHCPSWIYTRFKKVFALKLDSVESDVVSVRKGDIGYFAMDIKPRINDGVLVYRNGSLEIVKKKRGQQDKTLAVLLAVEKRYYTV